MHDRRGRRRIWITKEVRAPTDNDIPSLQIRTWDHIKAPSKESRHIEYMKDAILYPLFVSYLFHTWKSTHIYTYTQTHHNKTFSCSLFCAHSTNVLISRWKNYQSVEELLLLILLLNQEKWLWNCCFNFVWFSKWLVMWKILV